MNFLNQFGSRKRQTSDWMSSLMLLQGCCCCLFVVVFLLLFLAVVCCCCLLVLLLFVGFFGFVFVFVLFFSDAKVSERQSNIYPEICIKL